LPIAGPERTGRVRTIQRGHGFPNSKLFKALLELVLKPEARGRSRLGREHLKLRNATEREVLLVELPEYGLDRAADQVFFDAILQRSLVHSKRFSDRLYRSIDVCVAMRKAHDQ